MKSNTRAPAGRIAYVDGRYVPHGQAGVHIEDRGLQFSDAVYEVFAIVGGTLYDEEEHLDRLERSTRELGMPMPMARGALKLVLRELARRNRVTNGALYLQLTRGRARRDHPIPEHVRPTLILMARNIDQAGLLQRRRDGIAVVTRPDERWARRDIKSTSLLPNILAKSAARKAGAYEAWLVDENGEITEGSSTNAWIVDKDGRIITRDLSNAILPGVTRRVILEAAAEAQMPVLERAFTPAETLAAHEAFISAATAGVIPVVAIDGHRIGEGKPGPLTRRIQELYALKAARKAGTLQQES